MIHHCFGHKEHLFLATVRPPIDPMALMDRPAEGAWTAWDRGRSQMLGLLVGRFVLEIRPVISVPRDVLVADIGGTVQHYLTGSLGGPDTAGGTNG